MAKKVFNPFSGKWTDDPREKILPKTRRESPLLQLWG